MTNEAKTASNPPPQQAETTSHQRLVSLAPPPLLKGEDRTAYDTVIKKVCDAVMPADMIEDILVRDIVDLVWEALRLRRLKVALMNERGLHPLDGTFAVYGAIGRIHREGLSGDARMAATLDENLDSIERIERLTALAEARRIAILRELDRHRAVFASRVRQVLPPVEDAEYEIIEDKMIEDKATPAEKTEAA